MHSGGILLAKVMVVALSAKIHSSTMWEECCKPCNARCDDMSYPREEEPPLLPTIGGLCHRMDCGSKKEHLTEHMPSLHHLQGNVRPHTMPRNANISTYGGYLFTQFLKDVIDGVHLVMEG
jgi:hypothetical protein